MCWDEDDEDGNVNERDDDRNDPLHAVCSGTIGNDNGEAVDDELQYELDL